MYGSLPPNLGKPDSDDSLLSAAVVVDRSLLAAVKFRKLKMDSPKFDDVIIKDEDFPDFLLLDFEEVILGQN